MKPSRARRIGGLALGSAPSGRRRSKSTSIPCSAFGGIARAIVSRSDAARLPVSLPFADVHCGGNVHVKRSGAEGEISPLDASHHPKFSLIAREKKLHHHRVVPRRQPNLPSKNLNTGTKPSGRPDTSANSARQTYTPGRCPLSGSSHFVRRRFRCRILSSGTRRSKLRNVPSDENRPSTSSDGARPHITTDAAAGMSRRVISTCIWWRPEGMHTQLTVV
mmetsp:Transcript_20163/g.31079  ORF Transcript_20163/g.31079 Transcript_20163/m.31079 type:complete len:220 (+) Transcript_20163:26-685(+)